MSLSLKLTKIILRNFIGIYNGLGKKELTIDMTNLLDKDIIIILGENGTGKSTLSSVLHPLPGTTDKRNRFIREGKEGVKIVYYERSDGVKYECKVVYSPSKTGHNSKGFVTKTNSAGDSVELNPNGNISSYKEVLFEELGVSDAILKLANQNDVCKGHVDMTSTERKVNMSSFLPEDIYSHHFMVVDKIYKDMKTRINVLVEALGRMNDEDILASELDKVTKDINELVEKRDKTIGKIKELETKIDMLEKGKRIDEAEKRIRKEIKSFDKELNSIRDTMSDIYHSSLSDVLDLNDASSKITKLIEEFKKLLNNDSASVQILESSIMSLRSRRNSLLEDIESKNEILKDVSSNKTLDELESILKSYESEYERLEKLLSKLNSSLTKDDFMVGYEIIGNITELIDRIRENDYDIVTEAVNNIRKKRDYEAELDDLISKGNKYKSDIDDLYDKIKSLNSNSSLKAVLDKRPHECKIDDCPFIANAQKWTEMENAINKYSDESEDIEKRLNKINNKIYSIEKILNVMSKIESAWMYIKSNLLILNKLPYHEIYGDYDSFLSCILNPGKLSKADDFEEFIEIIEYRDDLNELKYKKIPAVETEIRLLKTQGKVIESAKYDLEKLRLDYAKLELNINESVQLHLKAKETYEFRASLIKQLEKFYDKKIDYDTICSNMENSCKELKELERTLEEIDKYNSKLKDKKSKLKEIDSELVPLTRKRELYKTEQLKIIDHKQELASIEEDMYKCEIIRDALSIKGDGIPVDALEYFMDTVRQNANTLLSTTFDGSLYLEEFEINSKDFIIPYKKNGDRGMDVSFASSSERSFISLCLTLAIIEEIVSTYGIIILDEIDRGFSDNNKYKFINILGTQIRRVGISQTFMITHNREYYDGYNLGYILFPGNSLTNVKDKDCVKVY